MAYESNIDIGDVLAFGWPGSIWRVEDNDFDRIIWISENIPKPTREEIITKHADLIAERKKTNYIDARKVAYPSIQDQLDMLYWDKVNGTDRWMDAITMIKATHKKGE